MNATSLNVTSLHHLDACARHAIYGGEIFCNKSTHVLEFASQVRRVVSGTLGVPEGDLETMHHAHEESELFAQVRRARVGVRAKEERWRGMLAAWIESCGGEPAEWSCDVIRLRAVSPAMHTIQKARAAFAVHRDTWYANTPSQMNVWLPLFDMTQAQSFGFYPSLFEQKVRNDSHLFNLDAFTSIAGFQGCSDGRAVYPSALDSSEWTPHRFAIKCGEALLFSASHLHGTLPNLSDRIRWSLDVRFVHQADEQSGLGALNHDNHSTGLARYEVLSPQ